MTQEKARFKAHVAHEIGIRLDDSLELAKSETIRWDGVNKGLLQGQKAIEVLLSHVDKDIDEGKYDLQTGAAVKLYVNRAVGVCANLAAVAANQKILAEGRQQMAEENVKLVKKFHDEELRKAEAIAAAEKETSPDSPESRNRPVGMHPQSGIKQMRLAEESPPAETTPVVQPVSPPVIVEPPVVNAPPPARKKPGPKPKPKS